RPAHERVFPTLTSHLKRIDAGRLPPGPLVASAMRCAVMGTAERYREFIARLAAERTRLHEAQVVSVRRLAGAEQAWLAGDVPQMLLVAVATWRADREHALVDPAGLKPIGTIARLGLLRGGNQRRGSRGAGLWVH